MGFLIFIMLSVAIFAYAIGFAGYDVGILLPILLGLVVLVWVLRLYLIKRKNTY